MRAPNPWIALPVLVGTLAGGVIGALVMRESCAPGDCLFATIGVGILSALVGFFGVGVLAVLAVRSLAEWREQEARGGPPPRRDNGPPTC